VGTGEPVRKDASDDDPGNGPPVGQFAGQDDSRRNDFAQLKRHRRGRRKRITHTAGAALEVARPAANPVAWELARGWMAFTFNAHTPSPMAITSTATTDARVDSYIDGAAEFARPILQRMRKLIHQACPHAVETIKWGFPFFEYHGPLCGFAAFKAHCSLFFWRDIDVTPLLPTTNSAGEGMGDLGKLTSLGDLPKDSILLACFRAAVEQRDSPKPKPTRTRKLVRELSVPADLKKALSGNAAAAETFKNFAPSYRREYIEWITGAKRPETRERRLENAVQWMSEGKRQNWKYM
jgi:hypothetical protein